MASNITSHSFSSLEWIQLKKNSLCYLMKKSHSFSSLEWIQQESVMLMFPESVAQL